MSPGSSFTQNGYTSTSALIGGNLAGLASFSAGPGEPKTSSVNLGTFLSTDQFAFRFRAESDASQLSGNPAWSISSVGLSNTELATGFTINGSGVPEPASAGLMLAGAAALAYLRRRA